MKKYEVQLMFFSNNGVGSSTHTTRSRIIEAEDMYSCMVNVMDSFVCSMLFSSSYKIVICEVKNA